MANVGFKILGAQSLFQLLLNWIIGLFGGNCYALNDKVILPLHEIKDEQIAKAFWLNVFEGSFYPLVVFGDV